MTNRMTADAPGLWRYGKFRMKRIPGRGAGYPQHRWVWDLTKNGRFVSTHIKLVHARGNADRIERDYPGAFGG